MVHLCGRRRRSPKTRCRPTHIRHCLRCEVGRFAGYVSCEFWPWPSFTADYRQLAVCSVRGGLGEVSLRGHVCWLLQMGGGGVGRAEKRSKSI